MNASSPIPCNSSPNSNQVSTVHFSNAPPHARLSTFSSIIQIFYRLGVAFTIIRCFPSQLFGMSGRRWSTRWLLCSRLERSYQAVAIIEFSRPRFFIMASFAAFTPQSSVLLSRCGVCSWLKESKHEDIRCTSIFILERSISRKQFEGPGKK